MQQRTLDCMIQYSEALGVKCHTWVHRLQMLLHHFVSFVSPCLIVAVLRPMCAHEIVGCATPTAPVAGAE